MMKKKLLTPQLLKNEHGMALVTVLIVIVVVSILGLSLMGLAATNVKMSAGERNNQSSYYIAESGANLMMSEITTEINKVYNEEKTSAKKFYEEAEKVLENYKVERTSTAFTKNFGKQPIAKFKLEKLEGENAYKIISTGTVDNRSKTVEQKFNLQWSIVFPNTAVFVDKNITVDSGASMINGSIGTNSTAAKAITLHDSGKIDKNMEIIVGPGGGNEVVTPNTFTNIKVLEEKISLELKPFKETPSPSFTTTFGNIAVPNNGNVNISSNTTVDNLSNQVVLNNLTINNNYTLDLEIGANNVEMYVNNLELNNNSILNVNGTGTLSLYVNGSLTINNAEINKELSQKNHFIIYLRKSPDPAKPKTVTASSSGTGINCSIFAEDANFDFKGGVFQGRFVTGGSVGIGGNNTIKGSIIAENMHLKGDSNLTFVDEDAALPLPSFKINPIDLEPVREK